MRSRSTALDNPSALASGSQRAELEDRFGPLPRAQNAGALAEHFWPERGLRTAAGPDHRHLAGAREQRLVLIDDGAKAGDPLSGSRALAARPSRSTRRRT